VAIPGPAGFASRRHRESIANVVVNRLLPDFIESDSATGQFIVERDRYVDG
jgi:hypothetical protein